MCDKLVIEKELNRPSRSGCKFCKFCLATGYHGGLIGKLLEAKVKQDDRQTDRRGRTDRRLIICVPLPRYGLPCVAT